MKKGWGGIFGAATTVAGLLASPEISSVLPGKYAAALIAIGSLVQAFTHPVQAVKSPPPE